MKTLAPIKKNTKLAAPASPAPGAEDLVKEILSLKEEYDVVMVAGALLAVRLQGDPVFPVEQFIYGILEDFSFGKGLTPDAALDRVRMFTEQFNQMRDASQAFISKYGIAS